ncbi:MAG: membrane dipeptidase [Salinivirgaceae bacterium]|nr:MAG: membrane dipeptidase [Salinivirgaceae bacterium]
MKILIYISLILSALSFSQCSEQTLEEKAAEIHKKALTLDSHTDTPLRFARDTFNIAEYHDGHKTYSRLDLPRMEEGGLDAVFIAAFIGQGHRTAEEHTKANAKTHEIIDSIYAQVNRNKDKVEVALTPDDAYKLEKEGKRSFFIGIENGYALGNDINEIENFYNRGVRYITLVHTKNNNICDSSTDTVENNGLSDMGVEVVQKMNELGMLIDVSHASDKGFYDIIQHSETPVIASHSNARAVCDNPRNMTDDMLKKLAENGGVIQVCLLSNYVKPPVEQPKRDSAFQALREKYNYFKDLDEATYAEAVREWHETQREYPQILAKVTDLVDHIDHIVKVAGIDHVGIGSDFDGGGGLEDCFDVSGMPNITLELVKRGYTEEDIIKIWGGNFMRVFREVQNAKEI